MSFSRLTIFPVALLAPATVGVVTPGPACAQPALPPGARLRLGTLDFRHTDPYHARLRFPADGKTLLSCDGAGVILWDLKTGAKLRTYKQGWLFAISPDGKTLALCGKINEIHLVDLASGQELCRVDAKDWIRSAAFSPDSATLFTGGDARTIRAWRTADGKALRPFKKALGSVQWMSVSEDGKTCCCLADVLPRNVQVFDTATGKPLHTLRDVYTAAVTPDGKTVVAVRGSDVLVWDPATGKERKRFKGSAAVLAISPDGNTLALAGETLRLLDLSKDKEGQLLQELRGPVYALAFSGDSKTLAAAGWGGVIRLWDWRAGKELFDDGHRDAVVSLAFSPDRKTVISLGLDDTVRCWELTAGKETRRFESHEGSKEGRPHFTIFHALDNHSLLRSVATNLSILDWKTGQERALPKPPRGIPAALSADGKSMVTYQWQGPKSEKTSAVTYMLWDLVRSEKIREFTHSFKDAPPAADAGAAPAAVAIAPDGKTIATSWLYLCHGPMYTARVGHGVSLWEVATGKERRLDTSAANNLVFLDDGKTLVCADGNGGMARKDPERDKNVMEFWDVATVKKLRELQRPGEWGGVLAFSPDGKLFASAGGYHDATVYLWQTATGEKLKQFVGHRRAVESLVFSSDGRMLASGSRNTTILLWEVLQLR